MRGEVRVLWISLILFLSLDCESFVVSQAMATYTMAAASQVEASTEAWQSETPAAPAGLQQGAQFGQSFQASAGSSWHGQAQWQPSAGSAATAQGGNEAPGVWRATPQNSGSQPHSQTPADQVPQAAQPRLLRDLIPNLSPGQASASSMTSPTVQDAWEPCREAFARGLRPLAPLGEPGSASGHNLVPDHVGEWSTYQHLFQGLEAQTAPPLQVPVDPWQTHPDPWAQAQLPLGPTAQEPVQTAEAPRSTVVTRGAEQVVDDTLRSSAFQTANGHQPAPVARHYIGTGPF